MFAKAENYCGIVEDFSYVPHSDNKIIEKLMQNIISIFGI